MPVSRRSFLAAVPGGLALAACWPSLTWGQVDQGNRRIYKSLKWGMVQVEGSIRHKLEVLRDVGFDGVEFDTPDGPDKLELRQASRELGFPIDGSVDSRHWEVRLTDPLPDTRDQALGDLLTAIEETHFVGGHSVLLVPGHGQDGAAAEIRERALVQIRKALPLASRLGVYILIENVWNQMFYQHNGPSDQTADDLAAFVDELDSPWVGVQFDVGNHQKYGRPAEWIKTLGRRVVKLDIKDWGQSSGFCKIGEGDVDWAAVRVALDEIGFTGWAAAEVNGGDRDRLADISRRMDDVLFS